MANLLEHRNERTTISSDDTDLPPLSPGTYEMDNGPGEEIVARSGSGSLLTGTRVPMSESNTANGPEKGIARHTLGLLLLLCVVFLWTLSNFLGSVSTGP